MGRTKKTGVKKLIRIDEDNHEKLEKKGGNYTEEINKAIREGLKNSERGLSRILKAKKPVNSNLIGPDNPLVKNTVHKRAYIESLQEDGSLSKMVITINEDYRDVIWMGVNVDGKFHVLDLHLKELINAVCKLSNGF